MGNATISRRAFVKLGTTATAAAAALALFDRLAFAGNDGGGGGAEDGGTGGSAAKWGSEFIWFDRGGFYATPGKEAKQGWDDESTDHFWGLVKGRMADLGMTGGPYAGPMRLLNNQTNEDHFRSACTKALENARRRGDSDHARIVGVGWRWSTQENVNWQFIGGKSFSELIPRPGDESELPASAGWGATVSPSVINDANGTDDWRTYIYKMGVADTPGDQHSVVVVAVIDGWPESNGHIKAIKLPHA